MAVKALKVQGTVEADETFFRRSFKGCRKLLRKPHKRGGDDAKPGLSDDQVPVLIAQDRTDDAATTDAILPDRSAASIEAHLGAVIDRRAVLVTDADGAFSAFANKLEIAHVSLNASQGERSWDGYHIQHVNAYCNDLKGWMFRFRGVATKYLDSYLGWHRMNDRDGNTQTARGVLVTDGNSAYEAFAAETGITQIALVASHGQRVVGCYHIQNVNGYVSRFDLWRARFKGVASKYLPSYLGWRRMIECDGDRLTPRHCLAEAMS